MMSAFGEGGCHACSSTQLLPDPPDPRTDWRPPGTISGILPSKSQNPHRILRPYGLSTCAVPFEESLGLVRPTTTVRRDGRAIEHDGAGPVERSIVGGHLRSLGRLASDLHTTKEVGVDDCGPCAPAGSGMKPRRRA